MVDAVDDDELVLAQGPEAFFRPQVERVSGGCNTVIVGDHVMKAVEPSLFRVQALRFRGHFRGLQALVLLQNRLAQVPYRGQEGVLSLPRSVNAELRDGQGV